MMIKNIVKTLYKTSSENIEPCLSIVDRARNCRLSAVLTAHCYSAHEIQTSPILYCKTGVYSSVHFIFIIFLFSSLRFPLPLGAWDGLRYFIVALPEPSI